MKSFAIVGSNLDEFFMVRVATLRKRHLRDVVLQTYLQDTDRACTLNRSRYHLAGGDGGLRLNAQ